MVCIKWDEGGIFGLGRGSIHLGQSLMFLKICIVCDPLKMLPNPQMCMILLDASTYCINVETCLVSLLFSPLLIKVHYKCDLLVVRNVNIVAQYLGMSQCNELPH